MTGREINCRVFFDTEAWCRSTEKLRRSIRKSIDGTRLYDDENTPILLPEKKRFERTCVTVTGERTFQCAMRLMKEQEGRKTGVLNFASATSPGGGVRSGASAQEESLCRCSTLYPVLNTPDLKTGFYDCHVRTGDRLYSDRCIYTPDIVICKSDQLFPERLKEEEWGKTDVISCAAPNLRPGARETGAGKMPEEELYAIHRRRAERILTVAADRGIEQFVTGAHGCGAFMNDPAVVARAWKDTLPLFDGYFLQIVFAVFTGKKDSANFELFSKVILQ